MTRRGFGHNLSAVMGGTRCGRVQLYEVSPRISYDSPRSLAVESKGTYIHLPQMSAPTEMGPPGPS